MTRAKQERYKEKRT